MMPLPCLRKPVHRLWPTTYEGSLPALQTINWLRHDVTPIGVAEGLPPAEKLATLQARCMALYGFARSSALPAAGGLQQLSQAACKLLHAMVCLHVPMPRTTTTAQAFCLPRQLQSS